MNRPSLLSAVLYIILLEVWFGLAWWWFGPLFALGAFALYGAAVLYGVDLRDPAATE